VDTNYFEVDTDVPNDPLKWAPHNGLKVVEHRTMGSVPFELERVQLYLTPAQQADQWISGHELRKLLQKEPLLNANFLDAWLWFLGKTENKKQLEFLFPDRFCNDQNGWHVYTFFWGTVYENEEGRLFVRYVCKAGETQGVTSGLVCLDEPHFRVNCPAAIYI